MANALGSGESREELDKKNREEARKNKEKLAQAKKIAE